MLLEVLERDACHNPEGFGLIMRREIHAFSDASKDAIGTAIFPQEINTRGSVAMSFLFARSKVAPTPSDLSYAVQY